METCFSSHCFSSGLECCKVGEINGDVISVENACKFLLCAKTDLKSI